MSQTHATKKGNRYRYYISRLLLGGSTKARTHGQRIPAVAIESLLVRRIRHWLSDPAILQEVRHVGSEATAQKRAIERAREISTGEIEDLHAFMRSNIIRVQVHADRIDITLDLGSVRELLDEATRNAEPKEKTESEANRQVITLSIPARLKHARKEMRIVVSDGSEPVTPDIGLVRLLDRANAIQDQLLGDRSLTLEDIAKTEGVVPSYATLLFRLTILRLTLSAPSLAANIRRN